MVDILLAVFQQAELPELKKMVANPPFSILEPMIQKISHLRIDLASLIIGENYNSRAIAKPGTGNFTKTSLFTQAYFSPEILKKLEKEDFSPRSREQAVIMRLVSLGREGDPLLQTISDAFSEIAEKRVQFLVDNICHEYGTPRGKITLQNYDQMITPSMLNISPSLLSRRLQELSNREISQLVSKLISIRDRRRRR